MNPRFMCGHRQPLFFLRPLLLSPLWPRQCSRIGWGSWALAVSDLGQAHRRFISSKPLGGHTCREWDAALVPLQLPPTPSLEASALPLQGASQLLLPSWKPLAKFSSASELGHTTLVLSKDKNKREMEIWGLGGRHPCT